MNQIYIVARFKIRPGMSLEFKAAAADCLAGSRSGESGTLAYEWFMSEEESEAIAIEAYAGSEALLAHMKNAGPRIPKLAQYADSALEGLGSPNPEIRERLKGRIEFVPRVQGLDAPSLADSGSGTDIRTVAQFRIQPARLSEFKTGMAAGLAVVAEKDPGTTAYEWFLDEARCQCTVVEMYKNVDALFAHSKNVGHLVRGLLQMSELSAELCTRGPASALAPLAKLPMKRYGFLQGLRA
jgi:quinol monooxygenase YgiN